MPFVTEEIYSMLPIKTHESIMISDYPTVNKEFNFPTEEELIENTIGFIKTFRNIKQENNITKDLSVKFNNEEAKEEAKWSELRNKYLENKTVWK